MTDVQLIALDVDGTLLDSRQQVSQRNAQAIAAAAARNIVIVLATGRRYSFVLPIAEALNVDCFLITSNGALVRRRAGAVHGRQLLPRERARAVVEALPEYAAQLVITFPREGPGELVMEAIDDGGDERRRAFSGWLERNRAALAFCSPVSACLTEDPVQLMYGGTPAQIGAIVSRLTGHVIHSQVTCLQTLYPRRDLGILDILDRGVNKGAALARLAAELGISRERVFAVGDNYNDLEMLEFAGHAVLMGNAHPEMRRAGWYETADNDHDGVAEALARMLGI